MSDKPKARPGRPLSPERQQHMNQQLLRRMRDQFGVAMSEISARYPELMQRCIRIALEDNTAEGMRMLRFLLELPIKSFSMEIEAETKLSSLREKWEHPAPEAQAMELVDGIWMKSENSA